MEKKVIIFMNSDESMCAAVYEFEIRIKRKKSNTTKEEEEDLNNNDKPSVEEDLNLNPTHTFFKQRDESMIFSVGACVVNNNDMYLIPDENYNNSLEVTKPLPVPDRILPIKLNLITKVITPLRYPRARKILPLVVAVGDDLVYALSLVNRFNTRLSLSEPCFESFSTATTNNKIDYEEEEAAWCVLPCSPFHDKTYYYLTGHALILDEFLLVSLKPYSSSEVAFYSFNLKTIEWKPVMPPEEGSGYRPYKSLISGEAVVIADNIYTYDQFHPGKLIVFSFTNVSKPGGVGSDHDLSLGLVRVVEGLVFDYKYPDDFDCREDYSCRQQPSCALAKFEDGIFCVLQSLYEDCWQTLHVCVSVIQLGEEDSRNDRCKTIKTFMCHLAPAGVLSNLHIISCFVLDSKETNDGPSEEGDAVSMT